MKRKRNRIRRYLMGLLLLGLLWFFCVQNIYAGKVSFEENNTEAEDNSSLETAEKEAELELEHYLWEQLSRYDLKEVQRSFEELFPGFSIDTQQLLSLILDGEFFLAGDLFLQAVRKGFTGELTGVREVLVSILVVGIVSALFSNFSDLFSGKQVSQVGYYFLYLLLMAVLTRAFISATELAVSTMENTVLFVKMFIPTWFLTVGATGSGQSAAFYYQVMLIAVYLVESFLLNILVPFVLCYVVLALLSGIWAEERLALLLELLKKGIIFAQKLTMGAITGLSLVQSVILPVADRLKISALRKVVTAIPGIGNMTDGVTELVIGSAVLIKNSMGILLLFLLLAVCLVPLLKLFVVGGIIKLGAALSGIISDKRISGCADKVGEGCFLLLRCLFTSVTLFLIVIAVVAYSL
ncbi:MAG: stage III sporulation protein AE [Lachnospiraceae bacterium]|nr:stage III sporulation protein AE [Lachnospiraceae bacterium]